MTTEAQKTVERLQELLDHKDTRVAELEAELQTIEQQREWRWSIPVDYDTDPSPDLPVPRIELRCEQEYEDTWSSCVWTQSLVYRHYLGHIVMHPLGVTSVRGGSSRQRPTFSDEKQALWEGPMRESAHAQANAARLNLPLFFICEEQVVSVTPDDSHAMKAKP